MSHSEHEVISTFLDDEPFDLDELANALDDPEGRALLIDLLAMRQIVQPQVEAPAARVRALARRSSWRILTAAAVLFAAVAGGYVIGERRAPDVTTDAPPATRVVEATPFTPEGGIR